MSKVFFGGSRNIGKLNPELRSRLQNLITNKHSILVGDANGADKAVQSFFADEGYKDVVVYCMDGESRNNVGEWPIKAIDSGGRKKDFSYFVIKDTQMSLDADYGFMIWDGASKGTLNNILNLIQQHKHALVYHFPKKEFLTVKSTDDVLSLVSACPEELLEYLNKKINLAERVTATKQAALGF